jgi:hypothetical protein
VQVHYDEGIANHIGPEPCADIREDVGEASVGERAGQLRDDDYGGRLTTTTLAGWGSLRLR